ncbi:MAG: hypothetical protein MRERV_42c024 [Mycoplasmataceae bacterium RV_VA103A]|nr:MAG: hypothetical protein MRERV_42c024 [Mycoplasmataceae bacterium RV_VA103A]
MTNQETKIFTIKVDQRFYEAMGEGQIFEQLKNKAYFYFGSATWNMEEGGTETKEGKIIFTLKVSGQKGLIKGTKDEARKENKSLWEKTKEKVGLKKKKR